MLIDFFITNLLSYLQTKRDSHTLQAHHTKKTINQGTCLSTGM